MEYIFKTSTTMKEYNCNKWWIERDVIGEVFIEAETLDAAIEEYAEIVSRRYYVDISRNAIKNKSPMYIDDVNGNAKQIGYVFTASTDFEKENYGGWSKQYIDLWVKIITVAETDFNISRLARLHNCV